MLLFKKGFFYLIVIAIMIVAVGVSCSDSLTSPGYGGGYYSGSSGSGGSSEGSGSGGSSGGGSGGSSGGSSGGNIYVGEFINSVPTAIGTPVTEEDVIPINRIHKYDIYPYLKSSDNFKSYGLTDNEINAWKNALQKDKDYISIKLNTTNNKIDFLRDYEDIFSNATWKKAPDGSFQISQVYKYSNNWYDAVFVKMSFEEYYNINKHWLWNYIVVEYTFARKYSGNNRDWSFMYTLTSDKTHFGTNTHLQ